MPVHNAENYLDDSIGSVLHQTYPCWELLIIDDCSTDNSFSVIAHYAAQDSRIRYFKTASPSGSPCLPRNMGIKFAQGRFIALINWKSNFLCLRNRTWGLCILIMRR